MASQLELAHDALWAVVQATFPDPTARSRNPAGHNKPAVRTDGLAAYVCQEDDEEPEVLAAMMGADGPRYDLKCAPTVTLAFNGKTKDERKAAARVSLRLLTDALIADPYLTGVVDYADIDGATAIDASDTDWMAGGIEVRVGLLFTGRTRAG